MIGRGSLMRKLTSMTAATVCLLAIVPASVWAGGATDPPLPVKGWHVWAAAVGALILLAVATLVLCRFQPKLIKLLIIGADERGSTSKAQAAAWTYAICFALLTLLVGHLAFHDFDSGWNAFFDTGLDSDYLWLLGIPSVGLVGAKAITETKVANDPGSKPAKSAEPAEPAGEPQNGTEKKTPIKEVLGELASDDNGDPALADLQYLVFNIIALLYFLTAFLGHAERGLPPLSESLLALTGVSAASYLAKKAATRSAAATIISVLPSRIVLGDAPIDLEISGSGFIPAGVAGQPAASQPTAMLYGVKVDVAADATDTHLTVVVPSAAEARGKGLKSGTLDLVVLTPIGTKSEPQQVDVTVPEESQELRTDE